MSVSYPRLAARTNRFTLGVPRALRVSDDGQRVWFLRTPDGVTRAGGLWVHEVATGTARLIADPVGLLGGEDEVLSAEERSRRERSRESGTGIVGYDLDATGRIAVFALSGRVWMADTASGSARPLPSEVAVDPRIDPTGTHVAYVADDDVRLVATDGTGDRCLVAAADHETWGRADFIAAEELQRHRGLWWSPDGTRLLVECFDDSEVERWHVGDPEHPEQPPTAQRYPAAGTTNATVTLWLVGLDGRRTEVAWDHQSFEYLVSVNWTPVGDPVIFVLSRDQRHGQVLGVDPASGRCRVLRELADEDWLEVTAAPRCLPGGRLLTCEDVDDRRRACVDGEPLGDPSWQVRGVVSGHADAVIVTASQDPIEIQVVRFGFDGSTTPLTAGTGLHAAAVGGPTTVITRTTLDRVSTRVVVHHGDSGLQSIDVLSEPPPFEPTVALHLAGTDAIRTAVLFPRDHALGSRRLPVLMNPYGGPHAQQVLASARMFLEPQWLADQGFCVVVADGRGTPGRGHAWERSVRDDLAGVTLADQIVALRAVTERYPDDVDPRRVGITGWSYGGYLAALAVLERPDLFHVAVAGAPVTEWRLYDTAYTERYLGHPDDQPEVYDTQSLLGRAAGLRRPLLLIHGLADDNVFAAHTLRLSSALLAAGRPHDVLPLSGITHMASAETVAENLALLRVAYLRKHLR